MDTTGEHIVEMQAMINKIMDPLAEWLPEWHVEAEHVLHLAHVARDKKDYDQLRMLDSEAKRKRKDWISVN